MLKGLKKTMDKEQKEMRKMIYEQNRVSINRNFYKKELSRNSGAKKYNNWNEKSLEGFKNKSEQVEKRAHLKIGHLRL